MTPKSNVLITTMTHNGRIEHLSLILSLLKRQSYKSDICVWNNSDYSVLLDGVSLFKGDNDFSLMQRFVPAILSDYEYVFYVDDDIDVGELFVEYALSCLKQMPEKTILVGWGSTGLKRVSENVFDRNEQYGYIVKNKEPINVDIGTSGCIFCRTELLAPMFMIRVHRSLCSSDMLLTAGHHIYNKGQLSIPPHSGDETNMIKSFFDWHYSGINSKPGFLSKRNILLAYLVDKIGWRPPSWQDPQ
jgi:hypothetical protein